jgi:hypothetical membrane protein
MGSSTNKKTNWTTRHGAWLGLAGPTIFIGGWLTGGALRSNYSPINDAISQLARVGAPNRALMTGAFIGFGLSLPIFGYALAEALEDGKGVEYAAVLAGLATLGVAAFPLSARSGGREDLLHTIWAVAGYVGTASAPLIASRAFFRHGQRGAAVASLAVGTCSALALGATAAGHHTGFYQRLGLTVVDLWFMSAAAGTLLHRAPPLPSPHPAS